MRSDCYSCHAIKSNPEALLCDDCQTREAQIAEQIKKDFPDASADQALYLKRQAMQAGGWHSRKDWTDPRGFSRAGDNRPQ
jgi:hypothetical protein